jgi:hypothetical protein
MLKALLILTLWSSYISAAELAVGTDRVDATPAGLPEGALHPDAAPTNPHQQTAIWKPFLNAFNRCIGKIFKDPTGCQPIGYEVMGNAMCHKEKKAIDIHAMKCKIRGEWKYYWGTEDTGPVGGKFQGKNFKPPFGAKYHKIANYNQATDAKSEGPHNYFSQLAKCLGDSSDSGAGSAAIKGCMWHVCMAGRSDASACHRDHLHCGTGCKSASL